MTLSLTTFSVMTLSIGCHYAEWRGYLNLMLSVVMQNDDMLNVIMLSVIMLSVIMLNDVILNVVMLSVVGPFSD
jgi:hypothetical protein